MKKLFPTIKRHLDPILTWTACVLVISLFLHNYRQLQHNVRDVSSKYGYATALLTSTEWAYQEYMGIYENISHSTPPDSIQYIQGYLDALEKTIEFSYSKYREIRCADETLSP